MKTRYGLIIAAQLFLLVACNSPEQRWLRLQRAFVEAAPDAAFFPVSDGTDTLQLPLPPDPEFSTSMPKKLAEFRTMAAAIDTSGLSPVSRRGLVLFRNAIDSIQTRQTQGIDAFQFSLGDLMLHFWSDRDQLRHPSLAVCLVENIPAYYMDVHRRWQVTNDKAIPKAIESTMVALDGLDVLEKKAPSLSVGYRERLKKSIGPARNALRDYIALCQSSYLEE